MKKDVVTIWKCKKLKQKVKSDDDALYNEDYGRVCNCGEWTKGDDDDHTSISNGTREIYQPRL